MAHEISDIVRTLSARVLTAWNASARRETTTLYPYFDAFDPNLTISQLCVTFLRLLIYSINKSKNSAEGAKKTIFLIILVNFSYENVRRNFGRRMNFSYELAREF